MCTILYTSKDIVNRGIERFMHIIHKKRGPNGKAARFYFTACFSLFFPQHRNGPVLPNLPRLRVPSNIQCLSRLFSCSSVLAAMLLYFYRVFYADTRGPLKKPLSSSLRFPRKTIFCAKGFFKQAIICGLCLYILRPGRLF